MSAATHPSTMMAAKTVNSPKPPGVKNPINTLSRS
jgi:hypothetical protein